MSKLKKREYLGKEKQKESPRISFKSDNRIICLKTGRKKFLYPTLQKALRACKYSDDPQRPYYCDSCCGYHTTSKTKKQYYQKLEPILMQRYKHGVIKVSKEHKLISKRTIKKDK